MMYVRAHAISTSEMISTMGTGGQDKQKRDLYKINGASFVIFFGALGLRWIAGGFVERGGG